MSTYVIGDIHGAYRALKQVFDRSPIKEGDTIIQLGDIADGWSEVYECVDLLISMKDKYNMVFIKGNHDVWFNEFLTYGMHPTAWLQGGVGTLESYCRNVERDIPTYTKNGGYMSTLNNTDIPESHIKFFKDQIYYYIDEKNRCYVHGGFDRWEFINNQIGFDLYWDRDLWNQALSCADGIKLKTVDDFSEIFIGHTSVTNMGTDKPMNSGGVYNIDTGAGWSGKLTIMNVDTKEYWQSDDVKELYKDERGRN